MHLILLGLVLVVGILVYYIMTTGNGNQQQDKKKEPLHKVSENLRKEDNVIFLPAADDTRPDGPEDAPDNDSAE